MARGGGWASLGVWDWSDVHVEDSLFENSTPQNWKMGLSVGTSVVGLHGTTIRNMWEPWRTAGRSEHAPGRQYLEIDDSQGHGVLLGAQVSTQCEHVLHAESPPVP